MTETKSRRDLLRGSVASILGPVAPAARTGENGVGAPDMGAQEPPQQEKTRIFLARGRGHKGSWGKNRNYVSTFVFDREQYEKLRELSYEHRLTLKETLFRVARIGLEAVAKNPKVIDDPAGDGK